MVKLLRKSVPYRDESLLSYIYRLAKDNNCPVGWIVKECKLDKVYKDNYFTFVYNDREMELLASAVEMDKSTIMDMTMRKYYLHFDKNYPAAYFFSQNNFKNGIKYCPLCLKEQNYHRLFWQFNQIKICLNHKVVLIENCPECGRWITIDTIINDKCECGFKISQTKPINCIDPLIIKNQQRVYSIYKICDENFEQDDTIFNGFSKWLFYEFSILINDIIYDNIENLYCLRRRYAMLDKYDLRLYSIILTEQVFKDWPTSFHILLEDLNNITNVNSIRDGKNSFFKNPDSFKDMVFIFEKLHCYCHREPQKDIIFDSIFDYIVEHYNMDFINKRFGILIKNKKYIRMDMASLIFSNRKLPFSHMFKTLDLNNNVSYVKVEDIVLFIEKLLKKANKWTLDSLTDLVHIPLACWIYNLSSQDFLEIINKYPIDIVVRISKFFAMDSIYVCETDLKDAIMKYRESERYYTSGI